MALIVALIVLLILVVIAVLIIDYTVTDPKTNQVAKLLVFLLAIIYFVTRIFGPNF
jgi:hypothetical protein